eukprot:8578101-Alexandrium_andersonii.AAC.1
MKDTPDEAVAIACPYRFQARATVQHAANERGGSKQGSAARHGSGAAFQAAADERLGASKG